MNIYVVCMDSSWIRDSQMFDLVGLPDSELTELDVQKTKEDGTIWSQRRSLQL